jgi:hypothetical protein
MGQLWMMLMIMMLMMLCYHNEMQVSLGWLCLHCLVEEWLQQKRQRVLIGREGLCFPLNVQLLPYHSDRIDLKLVDVELAEVVVDQRQP